MLRIATSLILFYALSPVSHAGKLADEAMWAKIDKQISEAQESAGKPHHCAGPVTVTLDKTSFKTPEAIKVAHFCTSAAGGLGQYCRANSQIKDKILKEVNKINCHYDASLKKTDNHGNRIVRNGEALDVYFSHESVNVQRKVEEFLKTNL